jgi:hypothetical protein
MGRSRIPGLVAVGCVALYLANCALVALAPRILAAWKQGPERDYALQLKPLTETLRPGDEVWGDPVPWIAVVDAGARLKGSSTKPGSAPLVADAGRFKYVIVARGLPFAGMEHYRKLLEIGRDPPSVFGMSLTNKAYAFDLWQSKSLD